MNYRFKEIKIKTHRPSNFIKNELDQEMSFQIAPPETMNLKATQSLPTPDLTNSELKDMRIEEKRNFELENCKLKSFIRNLSSSNAEAENVEKSLAKVVFFGEMPKKCKNFIRVNYFIYSNWPF